MQHCVDCEHPINTGGICAECADDLDNAVLASDSRALAAERERDAEKEANALLQRERDEALEERSQRERDAERRYAEALEVVAITAGERDESRRLLAEAREELEMVRPVGEAARKQHQTSLARVLSHPQFVNLARSVLTRRWCVWFRTSPPNDPTGHTLRACIKAAVRWIEENP